MGCDYRLRSNGLRDAQGCAVSGVRHVEPVMAVGNGTSGNVDYGMNPCPPGAADKLLGCAQSRAVEVCGNGQSLHGRWDLEIRQPLGGHAGPTRCPCDLSIGERGFDALGDGQLDTEGCQANRAAPDAAVTAALPRRQSGRVQAGHAGTNDDASEHST